MDVQQYSGVGARRDIIELTLLMQALRLGGFNKPVELRVEPSYLRILRGVADGRFVSSGALMWKSDIDELRPALVASRALLREGEFIVGVYTTQKNHAAFNRFEPNTLRELKVATNAQWKSDVRTIKDLGFHRITYAPNWINIVRMIAAGRAEITLAPFQASEDMMIAVGNIKLYPLEGIRVSISGSRHWPISHKHPDGDAFYEALERGLAKLEATGTIQRAYRECGFFHPEVKNWKLLQKLPVVSQAAH
ncbi:MAG TPA: hypothetical protein PK002_03870 [Cellvibrio sp.]|nr:hypothetical protein [Cellvibrio sp.]